MVDSVTSPELLAAELAAIEDLLQNYEDWRAWAQLEARERQGELPPAVAASGLKTLLLDKLANNTLFLRRQALVKQLEHVNAHARSRPRAADEADDLTRIRGIDVRLERRLNNLAVRSWSQIAQWTPADVHYFASTLGLGDLIARDQWIEQAAALSGLAPRAPAMAPVSYHQATPPSPPATAATVSPPGPVAATASPVPPVAAAPPAVQLPDPETAAPVAVPAAARAGRDELKPASAPSPPAVAAVQKPAETIAPAAKAASAREDKAKPVSPGPAARDQPPAPEAAPVEPDYPASIPARPLPASAYAGYVPKPPSAPPLDRTVQPLKTADLGPVSTPPPAPEPAFADLDPPTGAPAWYYEGAPVEPPHDLSGARGTPRPLAAAAYAVAETATVATRPAEAVATPSPEPGVLQTLLPPLPLQPAKSTPVLPPVATPPVKPAAAAEVRPAAPAPSASLPSAAPAASLAPTPAQMANIAAAAAAAAASASSSAAAKVLAPRPAASTTHAQAAAVVAPPAAPSRTPAPGPAGERPAATQAPVRAPEDLLRAATERAQLAATPGAAPPPLPPAAAPPPLPGTLAPAAAASQNRSPRPPAQPPAPRAESLGEDGIVRGSAPEARVTIRRVEDSTAPPVIRNPGGTPVHLSRQPSGRFDGDGYAAYHSEVEEAAVQIVKKSPPGVPATRRAVPPLPAFPPVQQADPLAGARTAAEAAARAAAALNVRSTVQDVAQAPATPPVPPPVPASAAPDEAAAQSGDSAQTMQKGAEKAAVTMGRFLKALTGQ